MLKFIKILLWITLGIFIGHAVHAHADEGQLLNTTKYDLKNTGGQAYMFQAMGQIGVIVNPKVTLKLQSRNGTISSRIGLQQCDDANYSSHCFLFDDGTNPYVNDPINNIIPTTSYYTHTFATTTLAGKYYALILNPQNNYLSAYGTTQSVNTNYFCQTSVTVAPNWNPSASCDNNLTSGYFYIGTSIAPITLGNTDIISFTPAEGETVSSTSPVSVSINWQVDPADIGVTLTAQITDLQSQSVVSPLNLPLWTQQSTTSGQFITNFQTSMPLPPNTYLLSVKIEKNCFQVLYIFGDYCLSTFQNSGVDVSYGHYFNVSATSSFGALVHNSAKEIDQIITGGSTTTPLTFYCSVFNWDTSKCLVGLFIPDTSQMKSIVTQWRDGFLSKAPWGYATRAIAIITGTASSSVNSLTLTFPASSTIPVPLQGQTLSFNPFVQGMSSTSLLATIKTFDGSTFWQVVEPWWNFAWVGVFIWGLFHNIIGHRKTFKTKDYKDISNK